MNIIHQEGKNMENKEQEKKAPVTEELSQEQMEKASGAGFFDRVGCFFGGHGVLTIYGEKWSKGNFYCIKECDDCHKVMYFKNDVECSETEYKSVENEMFRMYFVK